MYVNIIYIYVCVCVTHALIKIKVACTRFVHQQPSVSLPTRFVFPNVSASKFCQKMFHPRSCTIYRICIEYPSWFENKWKSNLKKSISTKLEIHSISGLPHVFAFFKPEFLAKLCNIFVYQHVFPEIQDFA